METPQGGEYPRTPFYHSIRAEWQKLEYMVFCQCSDIKQKKIFKAFFVVWSGAEHYKKQDLFPHILPTNIFLTIKKYKKTSARSHFLFLRRGLYERYPNTPLRIVPHKYTPPIQIIINPKILTIVISVSIPKFTIFFQFGFIVSKIKLFAFVRSKKWNSAG